MNYPAVFFSIRRFMYKMVSICDIFQKNDNQIIILCYHSIDNSKWRFSNTFTDFKSHIQKIKQTHTPLSLSQLHNHLRSNQPLVGKYFILTFDDGYADIFKTREFLKKEKVSPCVFVLTDHQSINRHNLGTKKTFLSTDQLKFLIQDGWDIGSHGATHIELSQATDQQLAYEIFESKKTLEMRLDSKILFFAYPKGDYSMQVLKEIKQAGFGLGVSMDDAILEKSNNIFILPRIGVDGSHSLGEFPLLYSPSSIAFRRIIKQSFLKKWI